MSELDKNGEALCAIQQTLVRNGLHHDAELLGQVIDALRSHEATPEVDGGGFEKGEGPYKFTPATASTARPTLDDDCDWPVCGCNPQTGCPGMQGLLEEWVPQGQESPRSKSGASPAPSEVAGSPAVLSPSSIGTREQALAEALQLVLDDWANSNTILEDAQNQAHRALAMPSATGTLEVPEGCTPTDAMVLREANAVFAEENHHLRRCLRWYANGEHYTGFLNWEGPSGDDNWLCPPPGDGIFADERLEFIEKMDEAMVEDGSVARSTLISGKFQVESPEEEPKLVPGEPEWKIEQEAKAAGRTDGGKA